MDTRERVMVNLGITEWERGGVGVEGGRCFWGNWRGMSMLVNIKLTIILLQHSMSPPSLHNGTPWVYIP